MLPPGYFMIMLGLTIASNYVPKIAIIPRPWSYLGIILVFFGAYLNLHTDRLYKKAGTTVKPHQKPTELITNGPFRLSRHPMYLGMASILLGAAMIVGSLIAFIWPIIFILIMEKLFIKEEEKNMAEIFGKRYETYRAKVRRWI